MVELSEKFGNLMARMAKTDAELFRTINDHNKAVTAQVIDLTTEKPESTSQLTITPSPLLPLEERSEAALKIRFKTCKEAFNWIEEQLGPPPKRTRTWSIAMQTITSGKWEIQAANTKPSGASNTQIASTLDQINQRLEGIESVLGIILNTLGNNFK